MPTGFPLCFVGKKDLSTRYTVGIRCFHAYLFFFFVLNPPERVVAEKLKSLSNLTRTLSWSLHIFHTFAFVMVEQKRLFNGYTKIMLAI